MTQSWQRWLPPEALERSSMEPLIDEIVAEWAVDWFATRQVPQIDALPHDEVKAMDQSVSAGSWSIRFTMSAAEAIGRHCAGLAQIESCSQLEQRLLSEVGRAALTDLVLGMRGDIGTSEENCATRSKTKAQHHYYLAERSAGWSVLIEGSPSALVALRRRTAAQKRVDVPTSPQPLYEALSEQAIKVGAHLGSSILPITAIRGLAVGDVLQLDQSIDASVGLAIDGLPASGIKVKIRAKNDGIMMLVDRIDGTHI